MIGPEHHHEHFDYDRLAPADAMPDAATYLVPIVSEDDGGVIGYAIGVAHAQAMVRALNVAAGEYEAEMQFHLTEYGGCRCDHD